MTNEVFIGLTFNEMIEVKDAIRNQTQENKPLTCSTCKHRQRWQCGGRVIQYCSKQHSNRTFNHLKKIKVTNQACYL